MKPPEFNEINFEGEAKLQKLLREYYQKYDLSQYIIDLIEEIEQELFNAPDNQSAIEAYGDNIGAMAYELSTLKEIINPELKDDTAALNELSQAIDMWLQEIKKQREILLKP